MTVFIKNWGKFSKYKAISVRYCERCANEIAAEKLGPKRDCPKCGYRVQTFASTNEYLRYRELRRLQAFREISDLETQIRFPVVINGILVTTYVADFRYKNKDGTVVVEDFKGMSTPIYRLKKKLMRAVHNIEIFETH